MDILDYLQVFINCTVASSKDPQGHYEQFSCRVMAEYLYTSMTCFFEDLLACLKTEPFIVPFIQSDHRTSSDMDAIHARVKRLVREMEHVRDANGSEVHFHGLLHGLVI